MDRWSRNMQVAMASMSILGREGVDLRSVTEDLDRSTPLEARLKSPAVTR